MVILNKNQGSGFTIVELLIVIVIIGILAAIVIVAYNGIANSAKDAAVRSDIENFQKKMGVENALSGVYPLPANLTASMGIKATKGRYDLSSNNWYYCVTSNQTRYAFGVATDSARNGYVYDSATGLQKIAGVSQAATCAPAVYGSPPTNQAFGCSFTSGSCTWAAWVN